MKGSSSVLEKLTDSMNENVMHPSSGYSQQQIPSDDAPKGWKTLAKIPLPMAYITRYLWGTDKIRLNFEEMRRKLLY